MNPNDQRRFNKPPEGTRTAGKLPRVHVQFWLNPNLADEKDVTQKYLDKLDEWGGDSRAFFKALLKHYFSEGAPDLTVSNHQLNDLTQLVRWIADQIESGAITTSKTPEPGKKTKKKGLAVPEGIGNMLDRYLNAGMAVQDVSEDRSEK